MKHVIFICTGNICRSAMAHGYLKMKIEQINLKDECTVDSAGIYAIHGEKSTKFAKLAIGKYGVDINSHVAKTLNETNIESADYILVMTSRHKKDIINKYPTVKDKVHLLKEYMNDVEYMDIDDPWGLSMEVYNSCASEIVCCVDKFIEQELLK